MEYVRNTLVVVAPASEFHKGRLGVVVDYGRDESEGIVILADPTYTERNGLLLFCVSKDHVVPFLDVE